MSNFGRNLRLLAGALMSAALLAACGGGTASAPQLPNGSHALSSSHRFTLATQSVKMQKRPSIASRNVIYCHGGKSRCDNFHLVTAVAINDDGTFTSAGASCDDSIFDAPWYVADGSFTLPLDPQPTIPYCTPGKNSVLPTPAPGAGYYLVKVDIGWLSLNVGALAGPSVMGKLGGGVGGNYGWTLPAVATDDAFQDGHLYSFFIATYNANLCPLPIAAS